MYLCIYPPILYSKLAENDPMRFLTQIPNMVIGQRLLGNYISKDSENGEELWDIRIMQSVGWAHNVEVMENQSPTLALSIYCIYLSRKTMDILTSEHNLCGTDVGSLKSSDSHGIMLDRHNYVHQTWSVVFCRSGNSCRRWFGSSYLLYLATSWLVIIADIVTLWLNRPFVNHMYIWLWCMYSSLEYSSTPHITTYCGIAQEKKPGLHHSRFGIKFICFRIS
jgi:hypothetical protein